MDIIHYGISVVTIMGERQERKSMKKVATNVSFLWPSPSMVRTLPLCCDTAAEQKAKVIKNLYMNCEWISFRSYCLWFSTYAAKWSAHLDGTYVHLVHRCSSSQLHWSQHYQQDRSQLIVDKQPYFIHKAKSRIMLSWRQFRMKGWPRL